MLAGQYVTHAGELHQVARIIGGPAAPGGRRTPALYVLTRCADGATVQLRGPSSTELQLAADQGQPGPAPERDHAGLARLARGDTRQGRSCACWRWDCAECGRVMHSGARRPA